ncbi:MAG: hypothetical protein U1F20_04090 [Lysobacterales bacterium]
MTTPFASILRLTSRRSAAIVRRIKRSAMLATFLDPISAQYAFGYCALPHEKTREKLGPGLRRDDETGRTKAPECRDFCSIATSNQTAGTITP